MSRQRPMEVIEKAEYVTIGELARLQYIRDLRKQGRSVPEIKAILAAEPEA